MEEGRTEPPQLKRGREHDRQEKESWHLDTIDIEFADRPGLEKYSTGRRGFTDIRGRVGGGNDGLVVEIKSDDLDRLSDSALRLRIAKYVAQVEDYMFSPSLDFDTVQAAIQFRTRPVTPGRAELVERMVNDQGISCVWLDG
ncbi:MAG: hypothetical protein QOJ29_3347 [Thermoleophilaceae bacterium]|nr:hypothetical protein [Thermoleophilaceae bacterium]